MLCKALCSCCLLKNLFLRSCCPKVAVPQPLTNQLATTTKSNACMHSFSHSERVLDRHTMWQRSERFAISVVEMLDSHISPVLLRQQQIANGTYAIWGSNKGPFGQRSCAQWAVGGHTQSLFEKSVAQLTQA